MVALGHFGGKYVESKSINAVLFGPGVLGPSPHTPGAQPPTTGVSCPHPPTTTAHPTGSSGSPTGTAESSTGPLCWSHPTTFSPAPTSCAPRPERTALGHGYASTRPGTTTPGTPGPQSSRTDGGGTRGRRGTPPSYALTAPLRQRPRRSAHPAPTPRTGTPCTSSGSPTHPPAAGSPGSYAAPEAPAPSTSRSTSTPRPPSPSPEGSAVAACEATTAASSASCGRPEPRGGWPGWSRSRPSPG